MFSFLAVCAVLFSAAATHADVIPRFEIGTLCCNCTASSQTFCYSHFQHLNYQRTQGHYVVMGTDTYRSEIEAAGNVLGVYHNDLNTGWTMKTGAQKAAEVHQYVLDRFATNGPAPKWVIINEISAGTWPGNQAYRTWVGDFATSLTVNYGYNLIIASPFQNPGQNNADWQRVATYAYIGIECYLSGYEVMAAGNTVSWCQQQYQASKNSYLARGIPASRLFLFEDFGQTVDGTGWGRGGVSYSNWKSVLLNRGTAIRNVGFAGFCSYFWGGNSMGAPIQDMLDFEDVYASQALPSGPATHVSDWAAY